MKKAVAILMVLVVLLSAASALGDGLWYQCGRWWCVDNYGYLHSLQSRPLEWDRTMANRNFPASVIQDVTALCEQYYGTPVGCLGLTSKAGSNLRSVPTVDGNLSYGKNWRQEYNHQTIVRKLHADTTVYVYFSFYSANGDEWYYVTCADGQTGFLLAKRIALIPMNKDS